MQSNEYQKMFKYENNYWWFVARKKYLEFIIDQGKKRNRNYKILDFGCGTGGTSKFLKKYGFVYGVDIDSQAITLSKRNGINATLIINGKLPYKKNYFDSVFLLDVFYHKNFDINKNLREIKRVLKNDGQLVITNPTLTFLSGNHDENVHTYKRYSPAELKQILNGQGFYVEISKYLFFFSLPIIILSRIFLSKILKKIDSINPLPYWLNNSLVNLIGLEIKLTKINNPIGSSVLIIAHK